MRLLDTFLMLLLSAPAVMSQQKTLLRTSNTLVRGMVANVVEYDGCSLRGDGLGPYKDQKDSALVVAGMSFGIMAWGQAEELNELNLKQKPDPTLPKARSLLFDLSRPVASSGAMALGSVKDAMGRIFVFWKHDHSEDPNTKEMIHCFVDTVRGQTVDSTRVEMWLRINGKRHVLQMGPWVMGEFSPRVRIGGEGTSQAKITRISETSWAIAAPKGSVARLWNYADIQHPIDKGLYYFDFRILASTLPSVGE